MKFLYFFDVYEFPKIPSFKSLEKSITLYPNSGRTLLLWQLLLSFIFSQLAQLHVIIEIINKACYFSTMLKI